VRGGFYPKNGDKEAAWKRQGYLDAPSRVQLTKALLVLAATVPACHAYVA